MRKLLYKRALRKPEIRFAIWYDNSSNYFEAIRIVEAASADDAVVVARNEEPGLWMELVVTEATTERNGYGNDPNSDPACVLVKAPAGKGQ